MKANTSSELLLCARSWVSDKLEDDGGDAIKCDRSELAEILELIGEIETKSAATPEFPYLVCRGDRIVAAFENGRHASQWAGEQSRDDARAPYQVLQAGSAWRTYDGGKCVAQPCAGRMPASKEDEQ